MEKKTEVLVSSEHKKMLTNALALATAIMEAKDMEMIKITLPNGLIRTILIMDKKIPK